MEEKELDQRVYALLREPLKSEDLERKLPEAGKTELRESLSRLEESGQVMRNKKNFYAHLSHYNCARGTFLATVHKIAYVAPDREEVEEGEMPPEDFFIEPENDGGAWHGDKVLVQAFGDRHVRGHPEGRILRVLSRAEKRIDGTLQLEGTSYSVVPHNRKYPILAVKAQDLMGAQPGDLVMIEVTDYGSDTAMPQGRILAAYGQDGLMETSVVALLQENGVFDTFPAEALAQAESIPQTVDLSAAGKRLDLREKILFTIDGDDAKDFDDAVSLEKLENGCWQLGVHIADVSHYVTPGSPLAQEAFRRGTSVYYPGHVVPMLPFALSNGICSLNPDADRLAFSVLMEIDEEGRRHQTTFAKSIIRSRARLTYRNVNRALAGDEEARQTYRELIPTLEAMHQLSRLFYQRRMARGALDLDIPETEIIVDAAGKPIDIHLRERGASEHLIEEFMLQANEAVAEHMCHLGYPTVYRAHEDPNPDKLRIFAEFARQFGYRVNPDKPENSGQLQAVLNGAKDDPRQSVLSTLLLRSLARARYDAECIGHYGLKARYYLHFTSPIRRYPDLIAHRMLYKALSGETPTTADAAMCDEAAKQSTAREYAAETCERGIDKLYIASYMRQFIGQTFPGVVCGVQAFGAFVMLENGCEGLLRIEQMGFDYYEYDAQYMVIRGQNSGQRFTIGTPVSVVVLAANDTTGQVDFSLEGAKFRKELAAEQVREQEHKKKHTSRRHTRHGTLAKARRRKKKR